MTAFAICTALYEAGRPYLTAYSSGLRAAVRGVDATLVLAVDDFEVSQPVIEELRSICPVSVVNAPEGATPARVRRCLIAAGLDSGADALVFADIDDVLAANATGLHAEALETAQISYGDLELIDAEGEYLRRRFFDDAGISWRIDDAAAIAGRNFLGLSNTAVRTDAIPDEALHIPADVVAADWWLFTTLLRGGRRARRTSAPVGAYRLYGGNTLGAGVPTNRVELQRAIDIALRHYRAFPATPDLATRYARLETLSHNLSGLDDARLAVILSDMAGRPGVWFEFLDRIDIVPQTSFQSRAVA